MQLARKVLITKPYDKLPEICRASFKEVDNTENNEILAEIVKRFDSKDTKSRDFVTKNNEKFRFRYIRTIGEEHILIQQKLHTSRDRLIAFADRYVKIVDIQKWSEEDFPKLG